ncbi:MAG TPA: hypothetical protein VFJ72_09705 [Rubrobacteraceae bacterium]|nr:hypothetical protein [Rubrobacteraceae bacterium]
MRANEEVVEARNPGAASGAPERARQGPENEEWAWMVDEDPVFYLDEPGAPSARGE